jgi:isocitrate dehydrogenase kinase/phosphatase
MSLYERKIEEQVDKLLPTNDYINALTKAILKNDEEEKEYLIQKIKEANKLETEMIYRDFHFDIHGNYLFDCAGNLMKIEKITDNNIEDEKTTTTTTEERKPEFSESIEIR